MTVHAAAPRRAARLLAACAALAIGAAAAPAQHPSADGRPAVPTVHALRLIGDANPLVRVDGLLDDAAWLRAEPATGFRQREPLEGAPATEETEVRVVYDAHTLYIGVAARDGEPDAVIARILQRDRVMELDLQGRPRFAGDDAVAVVLDAFHDHRNGIVFATNANAAEFDALLTDEGREFNVSWRGVWAVAARRTEDGWSAEFAIPFRTLRFAGGGEPWGLNVYRVIRRKNEEVLWSAWSRANEGFARISRSGHLEGLEGLPRAGLGVEFKPYSLTGGTMEYDSAGGRSTSGALDAGLDLKYEVRPGLVLDATLNTDFAQVEVDDEQVNLTRFDLFFPEKRDFFLENAGIFEFGTRGFVETPPFLLFFSRRIGIADDGEVPVLGGMRLSGRVGAQTVGVLNLVTESAFGEPRTNFAVLRAKRDVGGSNYVGAMLVDRRGGDDANTVGGLDWSFWPGSAVNVQGFLARTATRGAGGDDVAYGVGLDYQRSRFGVTAQHYLIGPEATAEVGFITRADVRRTNGFARFTARPRTLGLRLLNFYTRLDYLTRADGFLQDWLAAVAIGPEWDSGESFIVYGGPGFTRLDEGFDLADSIPVRAAAFDLWTVGWFGGTSANRSVVLSSQGSVQGIYDGTLTSAGMTLAVARGSHLSFSLGYTRGEVDLPGGSLTTDIARVRVGYAFSTRLAANALLQYNSLDRAVSANVRVNFVHRPGSDLFVVINEERGSDASAWDPLTRGVRVKATYLARF